MQLRSSTEQDLVVGCRTAQRHSFVDLGPCAAHKQCFWAALPEEFARVESINWKTVKERVFGQFVRSLRGLVSDWWSGPSREVTKMKSRLLLHVARIASELPIITGQFFESPC